MSNSPIASLGVVIPAHGHYRDVIARTLEAVREQTVQPRAVVVVIDGPDPGLEELVRAHASNFEILVLPKNSGGPATPRNEGAAILLGRHELDGIWFLDSDDVPHPRFIEMTSRAMDENPDADLVCTDFDRWTANSDQPTPSVPTTGKPDCTAIDLDWYLDSTGSILPSFTVVRTRCFSWIRDSGDPFDPSYRNNQDYEMFVRILHQGHGIRLECKAGSYRMHPHAISAQGAHAWLCRSSVNRDLEIWFRDRGDDALAARMCVADGSALRKAARHFWRRGARPDREMAIRLLTDDVRDRWAFRSLVLLLTIPMGLDAKSRRIPRQGDTRLAGSTR